MSSGRSIEPMGDTPSLVRAFAEAAALNGRATDAANYRDGNRKHDIAMKAYRELRRRGVAAQDELRALLSDENPWVRYWAAVVVLEYACDEAASVLERLAETQESPALRFNAELVLSEWRKGNLSLE